MDGAERVPLTGADIDRWPLVAGLDRAATAVVAGLAPGADDTAFVPWSSPLRIPSEIDPPARALLAGGTGAGRPLRMAVTGALLPGEIIPRLLACPAVGSVLLPVERPPGALMRRRWSWPLRIGVAADDMRDAFGAMREGSTVPASFFTVTDVRTTPGAVDVLVLRASPADAATIVAQGRLIANVVVCADDRTTPWPVIDARFALIRAASAAVATALVPDAGAAAIARASIATVGEIADGRPFDVALTTGFARRILLSGEPRALASLDLRELVRRCTEQARSDIRVLSRSAPIAQPGVPEPLPPLPPLESTPPETVGAAPEPFGAEPEVPPPAMPPIAEERARAIDLSEIDATADELRELAESAFEDAPDLAERAAEAAPRIDAGIDAAAASTTRLLQAYVGDVGAGNRLLPGANTVRVFVGPAEAEALRGEVIPQALLFDRPQVATARVTVVLAPLVPAGEAVSAELDVPRAGRSPEVALEWLLPEGGTVQARLLIIHRNRVLQTLRITGRVGAEAVVSERIVLWDQVGRLDDRRPFDGTLVLNHDATGQSKVVAHADGETTISPMAEIDAVARRIRRRLLKATQLTSKADDPARTEVLISVAAGGSELYHLLAGHLQRFLDAQRIQIVTARSGFFLPLELVYHRPPPDVDAALCPNWKAGRECGDHCFSGPDDASIVCPAVFWGMSRCFERQVVQLTDENGTGFTVSAVPEHAATRRSFQTALVAASRKVTDSAVKGVLTELGVTRVKDWQEWVAALADRPRDLLLLMPHTDDEEATMEISGAPLERVRIRAPYVTGADAQSHPAVVLFGCDTAGSEEDPAGFANWFMDLGAAFVFSTLTMLLARHAASMSESLVQHLRDPERAEQSLGEFVAEYRRAAVREGQISALAVTAYGDADWSL